MTANADVQSANTVGFTTVNLVAGKWYMIVPQFTKTGAVEGDTFNALDVCTFKGLTPGLYSTRETDAPQIQVHRSSDNGYDRYYYQSDAKQSGKDVTAWVSARAAITSIPVKKYKGFWLKVVNVEDGATITVAGEVRDLTQPIDVVVGNEGAWQIISNPFPCDLYFENMTATGITPGLYATREIDAPQIQVHRPSDNGYDRYYYQSDAKQSGKDVTAWVSARAAITSGKLCDAGKGFWLKVPSGSGKLTFKMPNAN